MLEIVFSQTAAGSLKYAASSKGKKTVNFIITKDKNKYRLKPEETTTENKPLGIKTSDIYCLSVAMNVGDISEDRPGEKRAEFLMNHLGYLPFDMEFIKEEYIDYYNKTMEEILSRYKAGEDLRLWYSDNSSESCEMYRLIYRLGEIENGGDIYTVKLPPFVYKNNKVVSYLGWGQVAPEEYCGYLPYTKKQDENFIKAISLMWKNIKAENGELRRVYNGRVMTVPEDYYDCFILKELEKLPDSFKGGQLVGGVLGNWQVAVSDSLIWSRVMKMIEKGQLEIIQKADKDHPGYRCTIRKTK